MGVDVIVVGAGLSGLVTAHGLHRAGLSVQVLEAAERPGGVIGSERRDGVLFERGPNSGMDVSPAINGLLDELGIRAQRVDASRTAARRYVIFNGRLQALPTSAGTFLTTPVFSAAAKLRLLAEPFVRRAPASTEESIAAFVRRRLGREILDYAVEPFVSGIYAGDPQQLSLRAAFPRLHEFEQRYGSLVRGAIISARQRRHSGEKSKAAALSFSFRDGMQTLTDALAASLPAVECRAAVVGVARVADGGFLVEIGGSVADRRRARAVVLALPAHAAARLVDPLAPAAAAALAAIPYAPIAIVVSAYRRAQIGHPLDGFGFLAPAVERPGSSGFALFQHDVRGALRCRHGRAHKLPGRPTASGTGNRPGRRTARCGPAGTRPAHRCQRAATLSRNHSLAARDSPILVGASGAHRRAGTGRTRSAGSVLLCQLPRRRLDRRLHQEWPCDVREDCREAWSGGAFLSRPRRGCSRAPMNGRPFGCAWSGCHVAKSGSRSVPSSLAPGRMSITRTR